MNLKDKYSDEEWFKIAYLPLAIGQNMALAGSDRKITSRESSSFIQNFIKAKETYKENFLIMEILSASEDINTAGKNAIDLLNIFSIKIEEKKLKSAIDIDNMVLTDLEEIIDVLKNKESAKTVNDYKNWLLSIARKVANASKDGNNFLGFGGVRINEDERKFFKKLKQALE